MTWFTVDWCPVNTFINTPLSKFHLRTVLSAEQVKMYLSETQTSLMYITCPWSSPTHSSVFVSHSRPVLSSEIVMRVFPSGLKHIAFIPSVCSVRHFNWKVFFPFFFFSTGVSLCFFEIPLPIIRSRRSSYYFLSWWNTLEQGELYLAAIMSFEYSAIRSEAETYW